MANNALRGHGALFYVELTPGGAFSEIGELNDDLAVAFSRPMTETTPHNSDIDWHVSGRLGRDPWQFTINYNDNLGTHDHLTGLQKLMYESTFTGFKFNGPGSASDTDDCLIGSGEVFSFRQVSPVREGQRTAEVGIQLSGPMKQDGLTIDGATIA